MRIALLAISLACLPSFAWHPVGHKIVAAICYDELPAKTRAKVDALVKAHPDYEKLTRVRRGTNLTRWAFINAAAWPDDIKGDDRFYSDTSRNAVATPTLSGFPDMKRHTDWHYINFYFSPDNTPFPDPPVPNVLTQLPMVLDGLKGPFAPYYLGWMEHLVGDIHQPMHNVSRWVAWNKDRNGNPQSDAGGNGVNVDGFTNLHAVWDDLLGTTDDPEYIDWMAARLRRMYTAEKTPDLDPEHWSQAGFRLAKSEAYKFGPEFGSAEKPFRRTPEYTKNSIAVANRQAALAGRRMAALLTARLR